MPQVQEIQQQPLFELESLTAKTVVSISQKKAELKKKREMLKDGYINNPTYKDNAERVKEAQKVLKVTKQQIDSQPGNQKLLGEIKNLSKEIKEKVSDASEYALEYERMSGADHVEVNGQLFRIVKSAKLVKT